MPKNYFRKDELIEKAWCDKTDFKSIKETDNLNENEVKKILRKTLKKKAMLFGEKELQKLSLIGSLTNYFRSL